MVMPGRSYSATNVYRYGFNGQEKSTEINGSSNLYTAEFWQYDSRLGRRWNPDPVRKDWESPYAVFSNNPMMNVDIKGNSDSTVTMPNGGKMTLPDGAKITRVNESNTSTVMDSDKLINVAAGSVSSFEVGGDTYSALWLVSDGTFGGYGKNGSLVPTLVYGNSEIVTQDFGVQKPDVKAASVMGVAVMKEPLPIPAQAKVVTALVTAGAVTVLTTVTVQTIVHDLKMTVPALIIDGYYIYIEKANDGFLKDLGVDAHELKKEWLGDSGKISEYDIYKNKDTGELEIFKKGGVGEGIKTGIKYITGK